MKGLKGQKGFTLVEIAIVLVIIGLLLGAVLKGQSMIKNAKIKGVIRSADEMRAAVHTYQDRYRALPGDDNQPTNHTGVAGLTAGDGDGTIELAERVHVFNHLAAAGIISGETNRTTFPAHAFGDSYYIYYVALGTKTTHWIVYENLPGDAARTIDYSIDDGVYNTGAVRAAADYSNDATSTLYIEF
ncbi:MAG: type II secretion system protein [Thermodesulfobacteriota bacterium]